MNARLNQVVLLDEQGQVCGAAPKSTVHTDQTPLHLGFSCHVVSSEGLVLMARRSLNKRTWPGVWSNSFCGHPQPGEPLEYAVERHARDELGLKLDSLAEVLPDFRYRAVDSSGVVENEVCPVFTAVAVEEPLLNSEEVCEVQWASAQQVAIAVESAPWAFSPWLVRQLPQLSLYRSGNDPLGGSLQ